MKRLSGLVLAALAVAALLAVSATAAAPAKQPRRALAATEGSVNVVLAGSPGNDRITIDEVTGALAAFEETLVTPNSRFDQWLRGDKKALTVRELAGYELFKNSGCVACHNGVAVGGNSFQKMGLVAPYQTDNKDEGRAAVTGKDADRFNFKVPTLRNVA